MQALRSLVLACGLLLAGLLVPTSVAYAADPPSCPAGETAVQNASGGWFCVTVVVPEAPGGQQTGDNSGGQTGDNSGGGGSAGAPPVCKDVYTGKEVPCTDPDAGAYFPNAPVYGGNDGCNAFMLQPQPPPGDPMWEGHDPSEGSVWGCDPDFPSNANTFFIPNSEAPTIADPAVLAQRALGRMKLVNAAAQIAPGPDFHTYINIENWLWIPADQWESMELTVSAGPTSVTVTAAPVRVEWDMGPEAIECGDAGRVWKKGMTDAAKTTCSYAYGSIENSSGDTHTVSAQLVYAVTWTCSGTCLTPSGDLGEVASPAGETTTIEVRQRQTVVTN